MDEKTINQLKLLGWPNANKGCNHAFYSDNVDDDDHLKLATLTVKTANQAYRCSELRISELNLE